MKVARSPGRRAFVAGGLALAAGGSAWWLAGDPTAIDFDRAHAWLDTLRDTAHRSTTAWPLPHVLEHLAQSIDYSLDGYPQLRSAVFRETIGPLALRVFARRGAMSHGTTEPIPGAPALAIDALDPALARLRGALQRFEAVPRDHRFAPHFAYGDLDRDAYARAHLLHLRDHARDIVPA